jgi:hypothetical protein
VSTLALVKVLLIGAVVFLFVAAAGTIRYRVTDTAIEVLILGWVARRIPLADIEEVHRRGALLHESWSGLKFWNAVTIRRRSGLLRNFVISPEDPDAFAARLEAARRAAGRPPAEREVRPEGS